MGKKQEENRARQVMLLGMFEPDSGYSELEVDGQWFVKMWNGSTNRWQVGTYTPESFARYKAFRKPPTPSQRKAKYDETVAYHEAKRLERELDNELNNKLL